MASARQLVAIMFTDIVGYTAMMQRNEQEAVTVTRRYLAVLKQAVEAHAGKILNDYGDGSLCVFSSARDAIQCAATIQQQLQTPPEVPLRIGLHIGEIFFEEGKVFGDGVNIASRIQSLGIAGAVLFSKEVYETIKNQPELEAVSLGDFEFKNVEQPVEVYALAGEGFIVPQRGQMEGKLKTPLPSSSPGLKARRWLMALGVVVLVVVAFLLIRNSKGPASAAYGATRGKTSIAVLYFSNMSGDPEQEYFSDGMTEEIITRLSMIKGLRVKSRTSVLQYKGKTKTAKQIARELGVQNILEGSVRKQGNHLRVTAQLIDARQDVHIWAENYDRELADVFTVQSDIAQQIADKFQIPLSSAIRKKLVTPPTLDTRAYDDYLKARSLANMDYGLGGQANSRKAAMELLRKVLQRDPSFCEAYALLSMTYTQMSLDAKDPQHWIDSALLLAKAAIKYGPDKLDGYWAMAGVYETTGHIDEAIRWTLKADEVLPYALVGYTAQLYVRNQQYDKAMEWTLKAINEDPGEPGNYLTKSFLFYNVGLLDSAKKYIDVAVQLRPQQANGLWAYAIYYRNTRNLGEYRLLMKEIFSRDEKAFNYNMAIFHLFNRQWKAADSFYRISTHPDDIDAALAKLHLGDTPTARRYFDKALAIRLQAAGYGDHWRYYDLARIYAALRDPRYIAYLQKAFRAGWHEYPFFQQDPFFDYVRPTPEYRQVADQVHERNERYKADLLRSL